MSLDVGAASPRSMLACVILAHADPTQVRRLIDALDPFPIYLHCDARTPDDVAAAMVQGRTARVSLLPRIATGWARWQNVEAELAGYRAALANPDATHVAVMTGADYPLVSSAEISSFLARHPNKSLVSIHSLPFPAWGRSGGLDRLRFPHRAFGKRMLRLPVPRRLPRGIVPAGGSQMKVLTRAHAAAVVRAADRNPRLVRFWRHTWIPDETFVPSILSTPAFVADWPNQHIESNLWWIRWGANRTKSPPWLGTPDQHEVLSRVLYPAQEYPSLFARKFATGHSDALMDAIDESRNTRRARDASPVANSI